MATVRGAYDNTASLRGQTFSPFAWQVQGGGIAMTPPPTGEIGGGRGGYRGDAVRPPGGDGPWVSGAGGGQRLLTALHAPPVCLGGALNHKEAVAALYNNGGMLGGG